MSAAIVAGNPPLSILHKEAIRPTTTEWEWDLAAAPVSGSLLLLVL